MRILFLFVFLGIWGSCKTHQTKVVTVYGDSTMINNEIAFYHFKVSKSTDGKGYICEIIDIKKADGRIDVTNNNTNLEEGKWLISYVDKHEKLLTSDCVSDPLNEFHEYINDNGKLSQANIKKTTADFFSRIQYHKEIKYIKIELIKAKNNLDSIVKLEI